jgi:hypothetical protein
VAGRRPAARQLSIPRSRFEHRRHTRKYAEGELGEDRSFYFRGPRGDQNLRAHNLTLFLQLADGVNDETWRHQLDHGNYSTWLHEAVKDDQLADEVESIERMQDVAPDEGRRRIRDAIESRDSAPQREQPFARGSTAVASAVGALLARVAAFALERLRDLTALRLLRLLVKLLLERAITHGQGSQTSAARVGLRFYARSAVRDRHVPFGLVDAP